MPGGGLVGKDDGLRDPGGTRRVTVMINMVPYILGIENGAYRATSGSVKASEKVLVYGK